MRPYQTNSAGQVVPPKVTRTRVSRCGANNSVGRIFKVCQMSQMSGTTVHWNWHNSGGLIPEQLNPLPVRAPDLQRYDKHTRCPSGQVMRGLRSGVYDASAP